MTLLIPDQLFKVPAKHPYPLLFVTLSGSHLYGFPSPNSDYDLRGVHILPLPEVIGLKQGTETIETMNHDQGLALDLVTHDVKKFFQLLLKKNGYVLEQLYSPHILQTSPEHDQLKQIATGCLTRYHNYHYLGFARTQWHLLTKEQPYLVKHLLYVYRVLMTGIVLIETGHLEANLTQLNDYFQFSFIADLTAQKMGTSETSPLTQVDLNFHEQTYRQLYQRLESASDRSPLPESPTAQTDLNDLLVRIRLAYRDS